LIVAGIGTDVATGLFGGWIWVRILRRSAYSNDMITRKDLASWYSKSQEFKDSGNRLDNDTKKHGLVEQNCLADSLVSQKDSMLLRESLFDRRLSESILRFSSRADRFYSLDAIGWLS